MKKVQNILTVSILSTFLFLGAPTETTGGSDNMISPNSAHLDPGTGGGGGK